MLGIILLRAGVACILDTRTISGMPMNALTDRQREILAFVHEHRERYGRTPTGPEIARRFGFSHHSTAYQHLRQIEAKGHLRLEQTGKSRPLRITAQSRKRRGRSWVRLGNIPAGPLDYLAGEEVEHLERLDDLLPTLQPGDFFLQVDGDSMEGAGLLHGMTVVIRPGREPKDGDICAAWIEGEGGTLKRVFREGKNLRLAPENPRHPERTLPAEQVSLQGVLVLALDVRRY